MSLVLEVLQFVWTWCLFPGLEAFVCVILAWELTRPLPSHEPSHKIVVIQVNTRPKVEKRIDKRKTQTLRSLGTDSEKT
jgi:hypothetical protein